jgi:hypothetical protein
VFEVLATVQAAGGFLASRGVGLLNTVASPAVASATGRRGSPWRRPHRRSRLAGPDRRTSRSRLLRSLPGLAVHRTRRPLTVWAAGPMAYFLLISLLPTSMTTFLRDNSVFARMAVQAGFTQLGSVQGYVSALKAVLAIPIEAFAAARVAALAADEAAGRLALLYAPPVSRARWAATEAAAVAAAATGLATWAGASWVGAGLGLGEALAGALSVVPTALLSLGAARTPAPTRRRPRGPPRAGGQIGGQPGRSRTLRTAQGRSGTSEKAGSLRLRRATRLGTGLARGFEPRHSPRAGRPRSGD